MIRKSAFFAVALAVLAAVSVSSAAERYENIHIANGLTSAAIGDWALFRLADGKTQKHTVVAKDGAGKDATATVQMVDFQGNVPTFSRKVTSPAGEEFSQPPMPDGKKFTFERHKETVEFDGNPIDVTVVSVFEGDTKVRMWYLTTEFPVYGMMKRLDAAGKPEIEIVTFGTGNANTDPYTFPAAPRAQ